MTEALRTPRLWLLTLLLVAGCGSAYAVRHRVSPAEDLAAVARLYGLSESELREFNHLEPGDRLRPGDIVFIPGARDGLTPPRPPPPALPAPPVAKPAPSTRPAPPLPTPREPAPERKGKEQTRPPAQPSSPREARLRWPVEGAVLRGYGRGPAGESRGIDIGVPEGSEVLSAGPGRVTYAGTPARAYGPMVILEHEGDLFTVYGNLGRLRVRGGQAVTAGQLLGSSGGPQGALPPHIHFEVRRQEEPVDPLLYLPPP